jgi:hypothetical protein
MRKILVSLLCGVCLSPMMLPALERSPWYGNDSEFELRTRYINQKYNSLDVRNGKRASPSGDHGLMVSLGVATKGKYHLEVEGKAMDTGRYGGERHLTLDRLSASIRRMWYNDIIGDPVSFSTGLTVSAIPSHTLRYPSMFHTSNIELGVHCSIGKERSSRNTWLYRSWASLEYICGNKGRGRAVGRLAVEGKIKENHRTELFSDIQCGLGGKALNDEAFSGYRSLRYRTVDVGVKYTYVIDIWGRLSVIYSHRAYAQYAPNHVNTWSIEYMLPFSL